MGILYMNCLLGNITNTFYFIYLFIVERVLGVGVYLIVFMNFFILYSVHHRPQLSIAVSF